MGRLTAGVAEVLRVTFRREALPPPLPPRAAPPRAPARLASLLWPEPLPSPDLPRPVEAARSRGTLSLLLGPDPLPPDLPPLRRGGGRWLAWLLSPESLDP